MDTKRSPYQEGEITSLMDTSNSRTLADQNYKRTYQTVFGPSGCTSPSGTYVWRSGQWVLLEQAEKLKIRKDDAANLKSEALSIHPSQIPEFEKFYAAHGIEGVKHDPRTGDCYMADRKTKLKVLKARGFIDREEICGGRSR